MIGTIDYLHKIILLHTDPRPPICVSQVVFPILIFWPCRLACSNDCPRAVLTPWFFLYADLFINVEIVAGLFVSLLVGSSACLLRATYRFPFPSANISSPFGTLWKCVICCGIVIVFFWLIRPVSPVLKCKYVSAFPLWKSEAQKASDPHVCSHLCDFTKGAIS